jgi:hypothetical protein
MIRYAGRPFCQGVDGAFYTNRGFVLIEIEIDTEGTSRMDPVRKSNELTMLLHLSSSI